MHIMKQARTTAGLALGLAGMVTLIGTAAAETSLRLGVGTAPLSSETRALEEMARLVGEHSGGELTVEVFPGGSLGASVAQIENLQLGTQDMHANVSDWYQHLDQDWAALAMPFLFTGVDHVQAWQATDAYEQWKQKLIDDHSIRILADNWYRLPKVLITKSPVFAPDDLEGMKLRMPNLDTYIQTWEQLGAKPTVIAWAEAFLAMKTGTVVGMDTPLSGIYPQKFYQAAPYVTMTNHLVAPYTVIIAEPSWQKLSPEQQETLQQAANEAGNYYTQLIHDEFTEQKRAMLAEGTVFIETNPAPFAEAAEQAMNSFEQNGMWSAGLVEQIRAVAP